MPEKKKYIRRPPPCHPYDVEGMESWLAAMAGKGYLLVKVPVRFGFLCFKKGEPSDVSYRLDASPQGEGNWKDGGEPDPLACELGEKYGWEFVVKYRAFYIYRSGKPYARELNTDPEVQAYSLKNLMRKELERAVLVAFWLVIAAGAMIRRGLPAFLDASSVSIIIFSLIFLSAFVSVLWEMIYVKKLQFSLRRNGTLRHEKKVRDRAFIYGAGRLLPAALAVFTVMISIYTFLPMLNHSKGGPEEIPFATAEDFLKDEISPNDAEKMNDTYTDLGKWKNPISPVNIYWRQETEAVGSGGKTVSCVFTADYHELISESLAQRTAEDYYRNDSQKDGRDILDFSGIDADYLAAYRNSADYVTVIIRKGRKVIHASFYRVPGEKEEYPREWAGILAGSM